jgi:hypothetical protein
MGKRFLKRRNLFYQERTINDKLSELEKYLARVDYLNVKLDFSDEGEEEYIEKDGAGPEPRPWRSGRTRRQTRPE